MSGARSWDDLVPRLLAGLVMAALGLGAIGLGGIVLIALAMALAGLMIWELAMMTAPERAGEARALGLLAAACVFAALWRHPPFLLALVALPPLAGAILPRRLRLVFLFYGFAAVIAAYGFVALREGLGLVFVLWMVAVVIASDVMGYFGGRLIGGPKFWPAVSPKKTWSGTAAGWAGAALVGLGFSLWAGGQDWVSALSVLVALAGQMGDIAESAIKRRLGVKDSSQLIPGHGGVLDRFDAMIGAVLFLILWALILPLPQFGG